jgi:hypothetical protein
MIVTTVISFTNNINDPIKVTAWADHVSAAHSRTVAIDWTHDDVRHLAVGAVRDLVAGERACHGHRTLHETNYDHGPNMILMEIDFDS